MSMDVNPFRKIIARPEEATSMRSSSFRAVVFVPVLQGRKPDAQVQYLGWIYGDLDSGSGRMWMPEIRPIARKLVISDEPP